MTDGGPLAPLITTAKDTIMVELGTCSYVPCKFANQFKTHVDFIYIHEWEDNRGKIFQMHSWHLSAGMSASTVCRVTCKHRIHPDTAQQKCSDVISNTSASFKSSSNCKKRGNISKNNNQLLIDCREYGQQVYIQFRTYHDTLSCTSCTLVAIS